MLPPSPSQRQAAGWPGNSGRVSGGGGQRAFYGLRPYSTARGLRTGNPAWRSALAAGLDRRVAVAAAMREDHYPWSQSDTPTAGGLSAGARQCGRCARRPVTLPASLGLPGILDEAMLPGRADGAVRRLDGRRRLRAGLPEPTAMVLSTVSADLRPRARMVLLKASGVTGFTFYTNRTSRKGSDLAEVPQACLLFPWHALQRQVIVEGPVDAAVDRRERAVFPQPPARLPAGRLGQPAVDGAARPRRARGPVRRAGAALAGGHAGADARVLGRLPAPPGAGGVLAGPAEPPA